MSSKPVYSLALGVDKSPWFIQQIVVKTISDLFEDRKLANDSNLLQACKLSLGTEICWGQERLSQSRLQLMLN